MGKEMKILLLIKLFFSPKNFFPIPSPQKNTINNLIIFYLTIGSYYYWKSCDIFYLYIKHHFIHLSLAK